MLTIKITEEAHTADEMADLLERIAELVRDGFTSGFGPDWSIDGDEEETTL